MRVHFFLDPVSGWTCWIPQGTAEADPQADKEHPAALRRLAGHSPAVRLLGRVGAWLGLWRAGPVGRLAAGARSPPRPLGAGRPP